MKLETLSVTELAQGLATRAFSAVEAASYFLDRIEASALGAFITVTREQALTAAKTADEQLAAGKAGPLTGVPIAHKDIFCTSGIRTSAGSRMLDNFLAPYSATAVEKLEAAGTVSLGKTNMDEFAMGSSNENSYYGPVKNPWDTGRVPGGSSGGSAAAMAAGLCAAATGTDTGGSIRQPAAHCGVMGIKPTYGRISRWGMIAYASSLDQAGILTRTAEDAALFLQNMSGYDPKDSTSIDQAVPDYRESLGQSLQGLKLGICEAHFGEGLDAGSEQLVMDAIRELEKLGASVKPITLPNADHAISAYYIIASAECSANLSRYDGVRFGYRCESPENLEDMYKRSRSEALGEEVKRRILVGAFALSAGYYDAYYRKAQQLRRLIKQDFVEAFNDVDAIVSPVSPNPAFELGAKTNDPVAMYLQDIYTISVNLAGLPALSTPAGFNQGLPVGFQLIGNYLDEARLLAIAHQYQQQTDWHRRLPETTV